MISITLPPSSGSRQILGVDVFGATQVEITHIARPVYPGSTDAKFVELNGISFLCQIAMARILILDPDNEHRNGWVKALRAEGHQVHEADAAGIGLNLAASHHFDLVVSELLMPDMEGLELITRLREPPHARRVIATTHRGAADPLLYLLIAKAFGASETLLKPMKPNVFVAFVSKVLAGGSSGACRAALRPADSRGSESEVHHAASAGANSAAFR